MADRHTDPRPDAVRIVIVDDHPLFREGVAATLGAEPGLDVVGEGGGADDALRLCTALLPDLLLLDLNLPGGGMHAAREVTAACPVTKIIMLTFSEEEADVLSSLPAAPPRFPGQYPRDTLRRILIHRRDFNFYGKAYAARDWPEIAAWNRAISAPSGTLDAGLKLQLEKLTAG
ncbi:response regulator transcription factor, partial [Deinococcus sp.]|uniref:response regulator n=1 Tax=Deinococcus sp. TaxID=47478 RepID=UPI00286998BB